MNLQRREEIKVIAECPNDRHWAQEMRRAVAELLAHIDTLEQTAAERVIARGAAVKPHTFAGIVNQVRDIANQYAGTEQLRERIAYALAPHFEHDAGPTPDYTGEGSAWAPPVEAPAAVVPELPTWEDGENKLRRGEKLTALEKFVMDHDWHKTDTTFRDGLEAVFAELRANQGGAAT